MKKILLLTAGFGEGHNAAARSVAEALVPLDGPSAAQTVDAFALAAPRLNAVSRSAYLALINRAPRVWSSFYACIDRSRALPRHLWVLRGATRALAAVIAREQPAVLCSTYPVYAFLLARLRTTLGLTLPHFVVVTDSISLNSLWWRAGADGWFLPNPDSADVLVRAGVDPARVHITGFPVASAFASRAADLHPPELRDGAAPRVLLLVHSGTHHAAETARLLLAERDWDITCAVGRDETLRRELESLAARRGRRATILGWTNRIPELLMTHHVVISKAGGATTQEAIAAGCPMIVNQIVPGQEEGNYELLRRHGIGAHADTPDAVLSALRRAFAFRGDVWHAWRTALRPLARPAAAGTIARHLLANATPPAHAFVHPV